MLLIVVTKGTLPLVNTVTKHTIYCVLKCLECDDNVLVLPVRFLNYLADLCVSKGTAVQTIQMMVCTTVLDEFNMNVLMQIE